MKELILELTQFKKVSIQLIEALQQGQVHKLDNLLDSRQTVIENMEKLQYTTEEFAEICGGLDIINIQRKLLKLMQQSKDETKEELNKIQLIRSANSNYNKNFYDNAGTFSKQI